MDEFAHDDFRYWVVKSIDLIVANGYSIDDNELIDFLAVHGIPKEEATEIVLFLPTAFCRRLLPEISWPPEYIEYHKDGRQSVLFYAKNRRYLTIESETNRFYAENIKNNEVLIKLAGRSAEFKAVTKLVANGSKITNIDVSLSIIVR